MFTTLRRDQLLTELVAHARADKSVKAAALVGSAARHQTDRRSDIDLALRLTPEAKPAKTADSWSTHLASTNDVTDHLDLWSGPVLYRVYLLADSLQVDLSFWPAHEFAPTGEPFELLFGEANPLREPTAEDPRGVIGWAWLYALHARSALARGHYWQAIGPATS